MPIGKCLRCDAIGPVTEDHVIPDWFVKRLGNFGVKAPKENEIHMVCPKCNSNKGGKIDFSHNMSRELVKEIIKNWVVEIRKHEPYNP